MSIRSLIEILSLKAGISQVETAKIITALVWHITHALGNNSEVRIPRLGTFFMSKQKEKYANHPKTGNRTFVKSRSVAKFRAAKVLKFNLKNYEELVKTEGKNFNL